VPDENAADPLRRPFNSCGFAGTVVHICR
jgi:hypothetical protein